MTTVWSVCVGNKYTDNDVHILRDMVSRHLDRPHRFRCLSDRDIPGIDTLVTKDPWPGWWTKLQLFTIETGQCLYLDLDVVVVGPLDNLITRRLSMSKNWAQSGHGGCQSSVMSWGQDYRYLGWEFDIDQLGPANPPNHGLYGNKKLWGDQEFINEMMGAPGESEIIPMQGVRSYKYHCQHGLPYEAVVVCFHGDPKPAQVHDRWVIEARSFTPTAA